MFGEGGIPQPSTPLGGMHPTGDHPIFGAGDTSGGQDGYGPRWDIPIFSLLFFSFLSLLFRIPVLTTFFSQTRLDAHVRKNINRCSEWVITLI